MNWYKKVQIKESGIREFFGLSIATIAVILGLTVPQSIEKIKKNPQEIIQQIQQINAPEPQNVNLQPQSNVENVAKMIERHEGKRNIAYRDTEGNPTIGIGFNLNRGDADNKLRQVGSSLEEVLNSKPLLNKQIYQLFNSDLRIAFNDAKNFLSNFNEQPEIIRSIIVDMAFNLGSSRLSSFVDFRDALLNNDYQRASKEMVNSKWYSQVGNRSKELVSLMRGA